MASGLFPPYLPRSALAWRGFSVQALQPGNNDRAYRGAACRRAYPTKVFESGARAKLLKTLAHPTGFEPVTSAFGGQRSIQLSYGC